MTLYTTHNLVQCRDCVTYTIRKSDGTPETVKMCDPCAIITMTENLPLVQIFDCYGHCVDCGQYHTLSEVGEALAKSLKGVNLTMCGRGEE